MEWKHHCFFDCYCTCTVYAKLTKSPYKLNFVFRIIMGVNDMQAAHAHVACNFCCEQAMTLSKVRA